MLPGSDGLSRFREVTKDGAVTYLAVEQQPPSRFVVRIDDGSLPYGGSWTYTLRAEGRGTSFTITEDGEVYNPIFRFLSRTVFSPAATIERYQASLRDRLARASQSEGYWERLRATLISSQVTGAQVHDARIAALCLHHRVSELWSADRDLSRFADLKLRNPLVDP